MATMKNLYNENDTIEVGHPEDLQAMNEVAAVYSPSGHGYCCTCAAGCEFNECDDENGGWCFERPDNVACECENCGVRVGETV